MRRHPIKPRKYSRSGQDRWRVHVPDDLVSKHNARDRHFSQERDAIEFARLLTEARKSLVGTFLKLHQDDQEEALRLWREQSRTKATPFSKICEDCIKSKKDAGLRENSLAVLKCATSSLAEKLKDKSIESVKPEDIEQWLSSHPKWSQKTKLNNYKFASSVFRWCIRRKILTYNPCSGVEPPIVTFKGVSILSLPDIRKLLTTCKESDPALLGFIVLVLFGGLRVAESARCKPENVAKGVIDLGGEQTKLNLRRCIKISPQLAAWLSVPGVEIGGKKMHQRMKTLAALAGVELTKNCLRHSFCSYTYPLLGAAATARAANNSENMLSRHYLGMVTDADAQAFAEILPSTTAP